MKEMLERFRCFYSFNNLLRDGAKGEHSETNFRFDSTRRFIDIVRFINRRWPYTIPFISSVHGESFWRPLFDNFPESVGHCSTLYEASVTKAAAVVRDLDDGFLFEILNYEDYRNGAGAHYYSSTDNGEDTFTKIPYDLSSFYMSLMFYGRASVPSFLYRQLDIEPGCIYKAVKK